MQTNADKRVSLEGWQVVLLFMCVSVSVSNKRPPNMSKCVFLYVYSTCPCLGFGMGLGQGLGLGLGLGLGVCKLAFLCVSKLVFRSVSVSKASPCVVAKRPHATSMRAFCRHTRRRCECTDVFFFQPAAPHTTPTQCTPTPHRTPHTIHHNHTQTDFDLESGLIKSIDVGPLKTVSYA